MTNLDIVNAYLGADPVDKIYLGTEQVYPMGGYRAMPLTLEFLQSGIFYWNDPNGDYPISYSLNGGSWTQTGVGGAVEMVNSGDKIRIKGNHTGDYANGGEFINYHQSGFTMFSGTPQFNAYGNVMSILDEDNFSDMTSMSGLCLANLFQRSNIENASNLILPATELSNACYFELFDTCEYLYAAPVLPASAMTDSAYANMFYLCTNLSTPPELPATTLAYGCYAAMFANCIYLEEAPELPATTLANRCYWHMFDGCVRMQTAPELPATILTEECYQQMFQLCGNIDYIECYAEVISATNATTLWLNDVASAGTFVRSSASTWTVGANGIPSGWTVVPPLPVPPSPSYDTEPLTFNILSSGDINWTDPQNNHPIEYKLNNGNWESVTAGTSIWVEEGDVISFRGDNSAYYTSNSDKGLFSGTTALFDVEGNILSMINSTGYTDPSSITLSDYAFDGLFQSCDTLLSAEHLYIDSGSMASNAYAYMFYGCTHLTTPPALPATTLADSCYARMFYNCTSLTSAPALPATTLANSCYQYMFRGCSSLTTAPALPATTLADNCYQQMFYGCKLTTAPALPATVLTNSCYYSMFQGCTSLTTAPALPATVLTNSCYYSMFNGCTSLTTAPALSAATLADSCCRSMFQGCTSLTTAPELPATTLEKNCYYQMFQGCTSLNYIKCLATNISATNGTRNWVNGVSATGTFVKDPNMTSWSTGIGGIPSGWSVQDA